MTGVDQAADLRRRGLLPHASGGEGEGGGGGGGLLYNGVAWRGGAWNGLFFYNNFEVFRVCHRTGRVLSE